MANIEIGGRLHSTATGNVVTGANEVLDDNQNKKQQEINAELIEAVGTGGSVDSRIAAAVNTERQRAEGAESALDGRVDTLEEAVGTGGSVDSRIADAKAEIKGTATSACDTLGEAETLISAETSRAQAAESALNSGKADKATTLAGYGITDAYTKSETYTKTEVNGLVDTPHQEYVTVDAYASLPATGSKDTIYRVSNYNGSTSQVDTSVYSEYAWNGTQYIFLCVKSQIGEVFDISVYNNNAKYTDLADALGTNGEHIPQSLQKGGMSIKYVRSSDNKYVQYRLMADSWSVDTADWSICNKDVLIENPEFNYVCTDKNGNIFYGIKTNNDFYFGAGVPSQVGSEINQQVNTEKTRALIVEATKVDKVEGMGLIQEEVAERTSVIENPEFSEVGINTNNEIIWGRDKDGTLIEYVGIKTKGIHLSEQGLIDLANDLGRVNRHYHLINPYTGVNFNNRVSAQSHEHCYNKSKLESAYSRGVRLIACSHYYPSCPRYPLSNFDIQYLDLKSKQAVLDGDTEMVTRHCTGSIPSLNVNGETILTDNIPQIANAERAYVHNLSGHYNILGLLWGSAGNSMCNDELGKSAEDLQIKTEYSLESITKFNELLEDPTMWQFGAQYAFGTINHNFDTTVITKALDECPSVFKAMELFNNYYSAAYNRKFTDAYDNVLKQGYRFWGTSAADWQGSAAVWKGTTAEERSYWTSAYNALTPEEQAEYGNVEAYYLSQRPYPFDRGTNVLLVSDDYNNLTPAEQAREGINAYISGSYFMSALNTKGMSLVTDNHLVTFKVSDIADKLYVITANGRKEYTNVNTVNYNACADDIFIRFEAYWESSGEFIYTNPVWVENENNINN